MNTPTNHQNRPYPYRKFLAVNLTGICSEITHYILGTYYNYTRIYRELPVLVHSVKALVGRARPPVRAAVHAAAGRRLLGQEPGSGQRRRLAGASSRRLSLARRWPHLRIHHVALRTVCVGPRHPL